MKLYSKAVHLTISCGQRSVAVHVLITHLIIFNQSLPTPQGGGLSLVATALVYLAGSTVLLMILSVYLSFVLPSSYGVRKSLGKPV